MLKQLRSLARRVVYGRPADPANSPAARIAYLEEVVRYLDFQVANQASLIRYLAAPVIHELPLVRETKESFDFQWAKIPVGRFMLENEDFRKEAAGYVTQFTGLPAEWFKGKRVIDAGCGLGRYSWALCSLGARVLSIDQSEHGVARTIEACRNFPGHQAIRADLLQPLPIDEPADLMWSFGVLHHTGDTYRAFKNIARHVRPGGYMYVMIYGKPREGVMSDYQELNEYDEFRRRLRNLSLPAKLEAVRREMTAGGFRVTGEEHVHGYFDAVSPPINDLYVFEEVESWFLEAGFTDITRTVDTRNLNIVASRTATA